MLNVVCVLRQGGKVGYDATWVDKLQRGVKRNLTHPHRFVCFSDCDVNCERIPLLDNGPGFWSKLQLFRPGIFENNLPTIYFDLDTVICGSLDPLYEQIKSRKFVMWNESDKQIHSSAFMYWQGDHSYLWETYTSKPLLYWKALYSQPPLYGDQALVSQHAEHNLLTDLCPKNWFHIASFKDSARPQALDNIKLLMFRKTSQKPSTMPDHPLVKTHWI